MEDERESAEQLRLKAQNMEKEAEALRDRAERTRSTKLSAPEWKRRSLCRKRAAKPRAC